MHGTHTLAPDVTLADIAQGKNEIPLTAVAEALSSLENLNHVLAQKLEEIRGRHWQIVSVKAGVGDADEQNSTISIIKTLTTIDRGNNFTIHVEIKYPKCPEEIQGKLLDALALVIQNFSNSRTYTYETTEQTIGRYRCFFSIDACGSSMHAIICQTNALGNPSYRICVMAGTSKNNFNNYLATVGIEAMLAVLDPDYNS